MRYIKDGLVDKELQLRLHKSLEIINSRKIIKLKKYYKYYKNFSYTFNNDKFIYNGLENKNIKKKFYTSSSTIIKHPIKDEKFILNIRCVNYRRFNNTNSSASNNDIIITINHTLILDKFFNVIGRFINIPLLVNKPFNGVEDIRLFNHNNKIYYIGSVYDNGNIKISSSEYTIGDDYIYNIINPTFKTEFKNEKNWVFFENNNKELFIIYKWSPIYICKINYINNTLELIKDVISPKLFMNYRGSTNGVNYDDKIWFIVHSQNNLDLNNIKHYTHSFVVLNNDLSIYGYTNEFTFENYLIEFCIGMTIRNNNFIITYSTLDCTCKLCVLSCEYIKSILHIL